MHSSDSSDRHQASIVTAKFLRPRTGQKNRKTRRRPKFDTEITKVMRPSCRPEEIVPTVRISAPTALTGATTLLGHGAAIPFRAWDPDDVEIEITESDFEYNPIMERDVVFRMVQEAAAEEACRPLLKRHGQGMTRRERRFHKAMVNSRGSEQSENTELVDLRDLPNTFRASQQRVSVVGRIARLVVSALALLGFVGLSLSFA